MDFGAQIERMDRAILTHLGNVSVTYAPAIGAPVAGIKGIFSERYAAVDVGEAGVGSVGPNVWVRSSDLPEDPRLAATEPIITLYRLSDGGLIGTYTPHEHHPDGEGGILLLLHMVGA